MDSLQYSKTSFPKKFHVIIFELHLRSLDKSGLKIDLESIIESKIPLMIDSEFLDQFRALQYTCTYLHGMPAGIGLWVVQQGFYYHTLK